MSAPEGYPEVNKFEQVSSLGHNMSLAFGGRQVRRVEYRGRQGQGIPIW